MAALIDDQALLERVAGDPEFLEMMVDIFVADAPIRLDAIRDGLGRQDPMAIERAAHSLKGALATMAADGAAGAALRLEQVGRSGCLEGASDMLDALAAQIIDVTAALQDLVLRTKTAAAR
jgi:HPt (histidine-containing phosphotransfer) domain-containing protein